MSGPTKWGFAGAGNISHDFNTALTSLPKENHQAVAVAARSLERAQEFAKKFNISKAYGSYKELAEDKDIDVVYIGVVNSQHYEIAKMMMESGKNVVVEKAVTVNSTQLNGLLQIAKKKECFFMEAIWSRFFPIYADLRSELDNRTLGDIKCIQVTFGVPIYNENNPMKVERGDSCLLDIGVYAIQLATLIYGERPEKIVATGLLNEQGLDEFANITLYYRDRRVAVFTLSVFHLMSNMASVNGTQGALELPSFWAPDELKAPSRTYVHPLPIMDAVFNYPRGEGFVYEAEGVRESLLRGEHENIFMSWEHSRINMEIIDEVRKQLGACPLSSV